MILDKTVEIVLSSSNFKHFKNLGYDNLKCGNKLSILIEELSKGSHSIIDAKCDICGHEKSLEYRKYLINIKKYNFYACSNLCAMIKNKKTNLERYGVENVFQHEEVKNKIKESNLEKYGVEYCLQNDEIIEKVKKTIFEKYGFENVFQNQEVKDNIKQHILEKYGVENIMQSNDIFEKHQKNSYILKYHDEVKLNYQGTYEKNFLDYCFKNDVKVKKGKRFEYYVDNKKHYYFSDFYCEDYNMIVEIKSNYTYEKYLKVNLLKQKSVIDKGYNFIFIIDKNYNDFESIIKK